MKIGLDIIQLSGDTFEDIGFLPINSLVVTNSYTTDITFDLVLGPKLLRLSNTDADAIYILKNIPIPTGSTFDWEANTFLKTIGTQSVLIRKFDNNRRIFELLQDRSLTFLIRAGSSQTADVLIQRK